MKQYMLLLILLYLSSSFTMEIDKSKNYFKTLPDELLVKIHKGVIKSFMPPISIDRLTDKMCGLDIQLSEDQLLNHETIKPQIIALQSKFDALKNQMCALSQVNRSFHAIAYDEQIIKFLIKHVTDYYVWSPIHKRIDAICMFKMPKIAEFVTQTITIDEIRGVATIIRNEIYKDEYPNTFYLLSNIQLRQKLPLLELYNFAARYTHREKIIDKLIEAGCSLDEEDKDGHTPLHKAFDILSYSILEGFPRQSDYYLHYALRAPVSLNKKDKKGRTPLIVGAQMAARNGSEGRVLQLLEQPGIHVNEQDNKGRTALMYACRLGAWGSTNLIKQLIKKGAKANLKDNEGRTAFDYVPKTAHLEQIFTLLESAAKINL